MKSNCVAESQSKWWFAPLAPVAVLLFLFISIPNGIEATTIDGTWQSQCTMDDGTESGPRLFGTLPVGNIVEIAEASTTEEIDLAATLNIPLPVYGDGSTAAIEDVLFTVQFEEWSQIGHSYYPTLHVDWSYPDPNLSVALLTSASHAPTQVTIRVWAFRRDETSAAPVGFGALKTIYE